MLPAGAKSKGEKKMKTNTDIRCGYCDAEFMIETDETDDIDYCPFCGGFIGEENEDYENEEYEEENK